MKVTVGLPISNESFLLDGYFLYYERELFDHKEKYRHIALKNDPGSELKRKKAVRHDLENKEKYYREDHAFPYHKRLGYSSMSEFMDGWHWEFPYISTDKKLSCRAIRYEYTIKQPIVDPATNRIFLNFYPVRSIDSPIVQLVEDDNRLFAAV